MIVNKSKGFTYDYIFDTKSTQEQVYDTAVLPLISRIFKGLPIYLPIILYFVVLKFEFSRNIILLK